MTFTQISDGEFSVGVGSNRLLKMDDGYWEFWHESPGAIDAATLRSIADKLDDLNADRMAQLPRANV